MVTVYPISSRVNRVHSSPKNQVLFKFRFLAEKSLEVGSFNFQRQQAGKNFLILLDK